MDSDILPLLIFGLFIFVVIPVSIYNRFIKYRNMIEESWSGIDITLKRRANLIPNLISAVKLYSKHESDVFSDTVKARHDSTDVATRSVEESAITQSLTGLLAVAEAYPDLKANQNFLGLQSSLSEVENDILKARTVFNSAVRKNNTLVQSFPSNIIAKLFKFRNAEYFSLELATESAVPKVN